MLLFSFFFSKKINGVYISPLTVYTTFFTFPSSINLVSYNVEISLQDWMYFLLICVWISFFLGYITAIFLIGRNYAIISNKNFYRFNNLLNKKFILKLISFSIISSTATLLCLYFVYNDIGFEFYSLGRQYELSFGKYTIVNYLYYINLAVLITCSLVVCFDFNFRYRSLCFILGFSAFIQCVLNGQKSLILIAILFILYSFYMIKNKINIFFLFFFILLVPIIFLIVGLLRNPDNSEIASFGYINSTIESYITYNYKNLENIILLDYSDNSGIPFIGYYFKIINFFDGNFQSLILIDDTVPPYLENKDFNVITYLGPIYKSFFGIPGTFLITYLISLFCSYTFFLFFKKPTIFLYSLNVILLTTLSLTFSAFEFYRLQFWFIAILLLILF